MLLFEVALKPPREPLALCERPSYPELPLGPLQKPLEIGIVLRLSTILVSTSKRTGQLDVRVSQQHLIQWCRSKSILGISLGSRGNQRLHHSCLLLRHGDVQSCALIVISNV